MFHDYRNLWKETCAALVVVDDVVILEDVVVVDDVVILEDVVHADDVIVAK